MRLVALAVVVGCGGRAAPPAPPPAQAPVVEPSSRPSPAPEPAPAPSVTLTESGTHRALAWLVEVIGTRQGKVSREELAQHVGPKMLGPVAGLDTFLAKWAADASGAIVESLEVDDPTYLRGYIRAGDKRWKVIFETDDVGRIIFLQKDP